MTLFSPGFLLAGVLLASIPIVIHLLNRRRFKEQRWAAMEFLLRAMKKNRKRLRFEQWLLLAMRCMLLAILGLALARPLGCSEGAGSVVGRQGGVQVILVDNSYSMSFEADRADARTHLDQAKRMALNLLDRMAGSSDAVAIVTASSPARVVFPLGYDREAARAAITSLESTAVGTDLTGALKLAAGLAAESSEPIKVLHILSDGTRSSLGDNSTALVNEGRTAAGAFTRLNYYHLGLTNQQQAALLDLAPATALVTARSAGGGAELRTTTAAFGSSETRQLQWRLDGQVLPGGGEVKVSETAAPEVLPGVKFGRPGPRVVSATLTGGTGGGDRLPLDDTRLRVVDVMEKAAVLIVEGERGGGPLGSSGAFLRIALAPPTAGGSDTGVPTSGVLRSNSPLEVEAISDLELSGKVLTDYRVLVLTGVSQIPEPLAEQLKAYVASGGVLITFMGEGIDAENYNRTMLPRGLLPGALAKRVSAPPDTGKGYTFDFKPAGNLHPMLSAFRGETKSGLDTAQVFTYWEVTPGEKVERVLNFSETGHPAITVQSLGEGKTVFIATSAGADGWTTLPAKPVFVSLMQEMVGTTVTPRDGWMNLIAGKQLVLPRSLKLSGIPELIDDAGRKTPLVSSDGTWHTDVITKPGVYTLSGIAVDGGGQAVPVVVNPDASAEADIRTLEDGQVSKALGEPANLTVYRDQLPAERAAEQDRGADFGWIAMLAVLGLVGGESLLAMKFGHHSQHRGDHGQRVQA